MIKKILLGLVGSISFISCDNTDPYCDSNSHQSITIINKSTTRIRQIIYWNYPDTLMGIYNPKDDGTDGLSANESFERSVGRTSCWESYLKNGKKEWIYFFNADSLEIIDWNIVHQTQRGLLARKEINLDSLLINDFRLTYP